MRAYRTVVHDCPKCACFVLHKGQNAICLILLFNKGHLLYFGFVCQLCLNSRLDNPLNGGNNADSDAEREHLTAAGRRQNGLKESPFDVIDEGSKGEEQSLRQQQQQQQQRQQQQQQHMGQVHRNGGFAISADHLLPRGQLQKQGEQQPLAAVPPPPPPPKVILREVDFFRSNF